MLLLFFISVGLIAYLSLFPWQFVTSKATRNPLWIVLSSWPRMANRRILLDIAANVAIYVPVGFFGYLAMRRRLSRGMAILVTLAAGTLLSATIEILQVYTPRRVPSMVDLLSNSGGTAVGIVLALLVEGSLRRQGLRFAVSPHAAGALLIVGCLAAYQLYPLMPQANLPALVKKVRALASFASFSPALLVISLTDWVAAAALLNGALGRHARPVLWGLLALVPARLVIIERTVNLAELAALPLAVIARELLARAGSRQFLMAAVILAAAILWRGLSPLSSGASSFSWAPFSAVLSFPGVNSLFLLKAFRYGALIWLLRSSGWRLATATGVVFLMLAGIEAAQLWTPGHTPEVTDPFLALLFGLLLFALERYRGSAR